MLSAKEARKISNSELLQTMNLIRKSAYKGGTNIKLDYSLSKDVLKVLKDYGYNVEYKEGPIFEETPYGKVLENIVGCNKETVISWDA
jgi:hypothetical protein